MKSKVTRLIYVLAILPTDTSERFWLTRCSLSLDDTIINVYDDSKMENYETDEFKLKCLGRYTARLRAQQINNSKWAKKNGNKAYIVWYYPRTRRFLYLRKPK